MGDMALRKTGDEMELNLMDTLHDLDRGEQHIQLVDEDSREAITTMQSMPVGTQEQIRKLLRSSERLQFVEKPSRWRCTSLFSRASDSLLRSTCLGG